MSWNSPALKWPARAFTEAFWSSFVFKVVHAHMCLRASRTLSNNHPEDGHLSSRCYFISHIGSVQQARFPDLSTHRIQHHAVVTLQGIEVVNQPSAAFSTSIPVSRFYLALAAQQTTCYWIYMFIRRYPRYIMLIVRRLPILGVVIITAPFVQVSMPISLSFRFLWFNSL